jgi:hypothetical protein
MVVMKMRYYAMIMRGNIYRMKTVCFQIIYLDVISKKIFVDGQQRLEVNCFSKDTALILTYFNEDHRMIIRHELNLYEIHFSFCTIS